MAKFLLAQSRPIFVTHTRGQFPANGHPSLQTASHASV
ncbi:uncharacterized protein G2W53_040222 [Senna tora]|uniref:Uncharacterized protein n=1 Tax=Senna tora TaxID=362788 RepID=A0A834SR98_9FABA|nr:uncharacterized protein G2W53_040222 [Senna tora]